MNVVRLFTTFSGRIPRSSYIPASYFGYLVDLAQFTLIEHIVFWGTLPLSLFALVDNGFLPGTPGSNRYGPEPSARAG